MFGTKRRRSAKLQSRRLTAEALEAREMLTAVDLTDRDQLLLELINRARRDPLAEAARFEVDLNEGLNPDTINGDPKQPLAPSQFLTDTARAHSLDMLDREFFAHVNPDGLGPADRAWALGYPGTAGENLAWYGTDAFLDRDGEIYERHKALFLSEDHRVNMLVGGYREVGLGIEFGFLSMGSRSSIMVTENFGNPGGQHFITGVAYDDSVEEDKFYTMGEGLGAVTVTAVRESDGMIFTAETGEAGGYGMQVPDGVYAVTATNLGDRDSITFKQIAIFDSNQKVDFNTNTPDDSALAGTIFHDLNGDGMQDVEEPYLPDLDVFVDVDGDGRLGPSEASVVTDTEGFFYFGDLRAGSYDVFVDLHPGWVVNFPEDGSHLLELNPSQLRLNINFAVQLINQIPIAQDDQYEVQSEQSTELDIFANDSDDGTLVIQDTRLLVQPQHGTVSLDVSLEKLFYRPTSGFSGSDFFEYAVIDDEGLISESARVDLDVQPSVGTEWQNPVNPMDVNGDSYVSSIDVLLILNDLNANSARQLPLPTDGESPPPFLDVSGDSFVTPIDALLVLNDLNRVAMEQNQAAEGEADEAVSLQLSMAPSSLAAAAIDIALEDDLKAKKRL